MAVNRLISIKTDEFPAKKEITSSHVGFGHNNPQVIGQQKKRKIVLTVESIVAIDPNGIS